MATELPGGWSQLDDSSANAGAFDLARQAQHDLAPDAKEALTRDGFADGYVRAWTRSSDGAILTIDLYRFGSAQGAADYGRRGRVSSAPVNNTAAAESQFPVPAIPDAYGSSEESASIDYATVSYVKGAYLVLVNVSGQAGRVSGLPDEAASAASVEYAVLP